MPATAAVWTECTKLKIKKFGPGEVPGPCCFRAFLRGVLEKVSEIGWFFVVKLW